MSSIIFNEIIHSWHRASKLNMLLMNIGHVNSVDLCGGINSCIIKTFGKGAAELGKGFKYVSICKCRASSTIAIDSRTRHLAIQGRTQRRLHTIGKAILIIDGGTGEFEVGISKLIVAVNKMDMTKASYQTYATDLNDIILFVVFCVSTM
ncbi:hypothetical protein BDR06DRAFT_973285 [Suillus hirtellus]|nr:hypothetical protein BDR06DRAFT_973285 [Suillus hirtellus]